MRGKNRACPLSLSGLFIILFVSLYCPAAGYPKGAPFSTCLTMFPKHGPNQRQTGPPPFYISLSPPTYRPGQIITVSLKSSGGRRFKGIQMKAVRSSGDDENVLGTFVKTPANTTKVFTCEGSYKSMVTHTEGLTKGGGVDSLTMSWKAPESNVGNIRFIATFLESYEIFWTGVTATLPTDNQQNVQTPLENLPQVADVNFDSMKLDTCGRDKGCFLYPRYCSDSDCVAAVTFRQDGADHFRFEMMARNSLYVSVGFSDDVMMGKDETVTCTASDNQVLSVQHGYNPKLYNQRIVRHQLSNLTINATDGHIMCAFTRPRVTVTRLVNQSASSLSYVETVYDLGKEYYLMLAWGKVKEGTEVLSKHKELPPVTDNKVSFQKYEIYRGSALPIQARIHASLMAVAWVFVAGLTTALSRYYKHWLSNRVFCGASMWFQAHRAAGVLAALLTISSVVLIVIHVGGYAAKEKEHAIVGFTVLSLVGIQILAGMFRPDKGSNVRPYFRWVHTIFGQSAHILSAAAMYLAFDIRYIPSVMKEFGITVLTGWVPVQIAWTIVLELRRCCTVQQAPKKEKESCTEILKSADTLLLFFYCLTLLLLAAVTLSAILVF